MSIFSRFLGFILCVSALPAVALDTLWAPDKLLSSAETSGGVPLSLQEGGGFGHAMAHDGVNGQLFVGAPYRDGSACEEGGDTSECNIGAVYRFSQGEDFVLEGEVTPPSAVAAGSLFGYDVEQVADWLAISAIHDTSSGVSAGAVYLYQWDGAGSWLYKQTLLPGATEEGAQFGRKLLFASDTKLLVAAIGANENSAGLGTGAVYIFENQAGNWVSTGQLLPSAEDPDNTPELIGGSFGLALAAESDWVFVGAPDTDIDGGASQVGKVYVFNSGSLVQELSHEDAEIGLRFGWSMAVDSEQLYVSAQHASFGGYGFSGDLTVFVLNAGSWEASKRVVPREGGFGHSFGAHTLVGESSILVSATNPGDSCNNFCGNSVYLIDTRSGETVEQVLANNGGLHDHFGHETLVAGESLLVAAYGVTSGKGEVYVYKAITNLLAGLLREAASVKPGDSYVHKVIVHNADPFSGADDVVVRFSPGSDGLSVESSSHGGCAPDEDDVACNLGTVSPGQELVLEFVVGAAEDAAVGQRAIVATVSSSSTLITDPFVITRFDSVFINNPPSIVSLPTEVSVRETASKGTVLAAVTAEDPDLESMAGLSFFLSGENTNNVFEIDSDGQLVLARENALNADRKDTYRLNVVVSDGVDSSSSRSITIRVKDDSSGDSGGTSAVSVLALLALLFIGLFRVERERLS